MRRNLISKEFFRGVYQLAPEKRQGLVSPLLEIFDNHENANLLPVKWGDANTFTRDVGNGQQILVRKFPEIEEGMQPALVWITVAAKEQIEILGKTIRFSWDGETCGLVRVNPASGKVDRDRFFSRFIEGEMLGFGVPANLIAKIREVMNLEQLAELEGDLTPRTYSTLVSLWTENQDLTGDLQILCEKLPAKELKEIESEIAQSLDDPFHSDRFCLMETREQVEDLLQKDLSAWMVFPTPDQKKWVTRNFKGPFLVRAGAGCGKTALAVLRARYLAQEILAKDDEWILLSTPYAHGAKFMQEDLNRWGGARNHQIEVQPIYAWASACLKAMGVPHEMNPTLALELLKEAIDSCRSGMSSMIPAHLDFNFVRDEIAYVIKGRAFLNQPDYLGLSRKGYGSPLSSEERRQIWRIYLKYQELLASRQMMDSADLLTETYRRIQREPVKKKYAAIVLDDIQDMPPVALRIFSHLVRDRANGMFMIDDITQKLTRTGDILANLGMQLAIRPPLLRTNLRTTAEIAQLGSTVLGHVRLEDLDGSAPSPAVHPEVTRRGIEPELKFHETQENEILWVIELIGELASQAYGYAFGDIAVIARSNRYLTVLELNLTQAQIPVVNFKKSEPVRVTPGVKLCTYQDCQGMEFPVVILLEAIDGILPAIPAAVDADELNAHLTRERCLFYQGINRARDILYISGSEGTPSRFLTPVLEPTSAAVEETHAASASSHE